MAAHPRLPWTRFDFLDVHFIDYMIQLFMMNNIHNERSAILVYEKDGLTRERLVAMLRAEGIRTCAVDDAALFRELCEHPAFTGLVVGVHRVDELEGLGVQREPRPLLVLAPLADPAEAAAFRVALGDAALVDRDLRDPDAVRACWRRADAREPAASTPDLVRAAFEPAGLSERQLEVLTCALRGESSAMIAGGLFISEPTVRNHLHALYARLRVSGRRELQGRFVQALLEGGAIDAGRGAAVG